MINPLFNVDRRPCVHLAGLIAFGTDPTWSSSAAFCQPAFNTDTGDRYPTYTKDTIKGVQEQIASMTYLYDRGMRRFLINSPCGNVFTGGIPAYGGIWDVMESRYVVRPTDNAKIPNPYTECWKNMAGQTSPPTLVPAINDPNLDTLPFKANGRSAEWNDTLRTWLIGAQGWDNHSDAEIYIYTGYGIPTKIVSSAITPDYAANYVREMGQNLTYLNKSDGIGFQMPDPDKNPLHDNYLRSQWMKWLKAGICGVGADVGVYGFNHRFGSWIYNQWVSPNLDAITPPNYNAPNTNMRKWFEKLWNSTPKGEGNGEKFSNAKNFSYFLEGFPWDTDPNKIINRTTTNVYPTADTDEYYSFWNPSGGQRDINSTEHTGGWMHYAKYIITQDSLTTRKNNAWPVSATSYNGADPNRKWRFDPSSTEIHILAQSLARPFTADTDAVLGGFETTINTPQTQAIIADCVDWWLYYFQECGYVYQPLVYYNSYKIQKHIHKGIMQGLGYWPQSDPAP